MYTAFLDSTGHASSFASRLTRCFCAPLVRGFAAELAWHLWTKEQGSARVRSLIVRSPQSSRLSSGFPKASRARWSTRCSRKGWGQKTWQVDGAGALDLAIACRSQRSPRPSYARVDCRRMKATNAWSASRFFMGSNRKKPKRRRLRNS